MLRYEDWKEGNRVEEILEKVHFRFEVVIVCERTEDNDTGCMEGFKDVAI